MTLGMADKQGDLLDDVTRFCDETLDEHSNSSGATVYDPTNIQTATIYNGPPDPGAGC